MMLKISENFSTAVLLFLLRHCPTFFIVLFWMYGNFNVMIVCIHKTCESFLDFVAVMQIIDRIGDKFRLKKRRDC